MAVARPQPAGGSTGAKIALIVFVGLTVVSLGGLIFLFTQQEKVRTQAETQQQAAQLANDAEGTAERELSNFALQIIGESTNDVGKIRQSIDTTLQPLLNDPMVKDARIDGTVVMTTVQELHDLLKNKSEELQSRLVELENLRAQIKTMNESGETLNTDFKQNMGELLNKYQALNEQFTSERTGWQNQIQKLDGRLTAASESALEELNIERRLRQQAEDSFEKERERNKELIAQLQQFKPSVNENDILKVQDGSIVRAPSRDGITYINLGRADQIREGMTFAVYSRFHGITDNGKGKATIKVTNVLDETSECMVTSTTPGNPVIFGDIIANPVYDRSHRYTYAVAGDFDLDYDGTAEDRGGEEVAALIRVMGGDVVTRVTTTTDFVVVGTIPGGDVLVPLPEGTAEDAAIERRKELDKKREAFNRLVGEARALSIPILTRTQFLHFAGKNVPSSIPDDPRPGYLSAGSN